MAQSNKERLREITDSIEQGIKDLFASDRYAEYLRTMSRFHRYSANNVMLIHMQMPGATHVAGFNKWRDQFGRHVKKGEKSIKIIAPTPFKKKIEEVKRDPDTQAPLLDQDGKAIIEEREVQIPMFKVVSVFDVSQTEGKPLPQLAGDLKGNVQHYEEFLEALRRSAPVPISFERMAENMDGYFDTKNQSIAIREGMSEVQTISAAVHEIAHSKLHNPELDTAKPEWKIVMTSNGTKQDYMGGFETEAEAEAAAAAADWRFLDENEFEWGLEVEEDTAAAVKIERTRQTEEVEAESISYAVCQYYGIETGENSFGYIASWSKGKELKELKESLETINKTAGGLIGDIDRHFAEICKERGIDLTAEKQAEAPAAEQPAVETPAPEQPVTEQPVTEPSAPETAPAPAPELAATETPEPSPAPEQETGSRFHPPKELLHAIDDSVYLHIQSTDTGYDFTLYDIDTMKQLDGGQLDNPDIPYSTATLEICSMYGIGHESIKYAPLDMIETLQEAAYRQMQEQAAKTSPEAAAAEALASDAGEPAPDMLPDAQEQTLDEYPMPDEVLNLSDLEQAGYLDGDMLPLTRERAAELFEKDLTVYAIVDGGQAEMMLDLQDIENLPLDGVFAVSREEWEESRDFDSLVQDRKNHQEEREAAFLAHTGDCFAIYQLKDDEALRDIRFEPTEWLQSIGRTVERENYDLIYTAPLPDAGSVNASLNGLWEQFNNDHPADYHSPSLSVSDIVAIKRDGQVSCHYVDSFGFTELTGFLSASPLKNAEMSVEDDYGMIDGLINNGEKQPTVAELEQQARSGRPISLLNLAEAVQREEKQKRKSVVEQLKAQPKREHNKKAPKKSAEREI